MEAEMSTELKSPEERRLSVIEWRKECALMKRKVIEDKRQSWNEFLKRMDCRPDGKEAYRLLNTMSSRNKVKLNHPMKIGNKVLTNPRDIAEKFNEVFLNKYIHITHRCEVKTTGIRTIS